MPVGIDTSVLIAAEKQGGIDRLLPAEDGPFYIPALAATEFLVGIHPPVRADLRHRASFKRPIKKIRRFGRSGNFCRAEEKPA